MNFNFLSAFKGAWAIEPKSVAAYAVAAAEIIKSGNIELLKQKAVRPSVVEAKQNPKHSKGNVAIIPMIGPLFKDSAPDWGIVGDRERAKWFKEAYANEEIEAIILHTETPGGTVDGTEEFVEILNQRNKPVVQFVDGMSCSKGVWIGSNCDKIIAATDHTEVGSIGVMIALTDYVPMLEKWGAKSHHVIADQSKDKNKAYYDLLEGKYETIKKEALNPLADAFIKTVKTNRPAVTNDQLTGKVYFAKDIKGSLIDDIGNLDFAIENALEVANNNFHLNNKSMSKETQIADEKTLIQKIGAAFGLKTVEEKKTETEKKVLEEKKKEIAQLNAKLEKTKTLTASLTEENTALKAENTTLKAQPAAEPVVAVTDKNQVATTEGDPCVTSGDDFLADMQAVKDAYL